MMNFKQFWEWFTTDPAKVKKAMSAQNQIPKGSIAQTGGKVESGRPQVRSQNTTLLQQGLEQPQLTSKDSTTTKKLGYAVVLFILINSILGSSLFYLPGLGVLSSGPASIIAWIVLFLIASWIMLYIGELITLHPTSGGTYEFCKRAYGRFGSFGAGWLIWLAGNFGMALNVVAAAEYFIPGAPSGGILTLRMIFAAIWILVLNYMAFRGIDAGATMLVVFGIVATIVLVVMTVPSFIDIPALTQGVVQSPYSFSYLDMFFQGNGLGLLAALGLSLFLISEAFMGFETVSYLANEVKEPRKLHRMLLTAIIFCGIIMTLYVLSSLGTVSYSDYTHDARPFAVQALNTMGEVGQKIVVFGMYLVIVGAAAGWPITGSRLIQAMAQDKLFIKQLAILHPKHKSPHRAVYFQTFVVGLFSWLLFRGYQVGWKDPYRTFYLMYVLISLVVITLILLTVPILRRKEKELERPFKAPFGTLGPIALALFFAVLLINWIWIEKGIAYTIIKLAGSFVLVGLPFYFLVEMFYDPKAIVKVNEKLSYLVLVGEKIFFPFSIRNKILREMKDIQGKKLLEFGCSVGSLTTKLAEKVTAKGKIYATDLSLTKVQIVMKRTKHFSQVQAFHHPHLDAFQWQLPEKVDGVISVGMLSYMQHPVQVLQGLGAQVQRGGEVVFIDYDKFFYFIPNVHWIQNDQQLQEAFSKAGFAVEIERTRGLLWQYIVIYGYKV